LADCRQRNTLPAWESAAEELLWRGIGHYEYELNHTRIGGTA
jgi:hypothetical protein